MEVDTLKKNNITRENIVNYISDYALQENVSIEEAGFIADFCEELLKYFDKKGNV